MGFFVGFSFRASLVWYLVLSIEMLSLYVILVSVLSTQYQSKAQGEGKPQGAELKQNQVNHPQHATLVQSGETKKRKNIYSPRKFFYPRFSNLYNTTLNASQIAEMRLNPLRKSGYKVNLFFYCV